MTMIPASCGSGGAETMSGCCSLHPYMPTLTKRAKPVGWDGSKPMSYREEHWAVSLRGSLITDPGMFSDRRSAENYIWLLQHDVHNTDPGILNAEVVVGSDD